MRSRLRRWWARCFPKDEAATEFAAEMKAARAFGVDQQRRSYRSIRDMQHQLGMDYGELHRTMFGRSPWDERKAEQ